MSNTLPAVETLPDLSSEERAKVLDLLFEPSTQLHSLSVETLKQVFTTYAGLIKAIDAQLRTLLDSELSSDQKWLEGILSSHPRLGAKKVDSAQSQAEQAQLKGSAEEAKQLCELNEKYEGKYPGLRYVVFVNGRSRVVIMDDMRRRISESDLKSEKMAAIEAMCQIAVDRAAKAGHS